MSSWISVTDQLPPSGKSVLASYRNGSHGFDDWNHVIRARYIGECMQESDCDDDEAEYSEEHDSYFTTAGWYESINNWDEFSCVSVTDGDVTHWMPLPTAPGKPTEFDVLRALLVDAKAALDPFDDKILEARINAALTT